MLNSPKPPKFLRLLAALLLPALLPATAAHAQAWRPNKQVELIVWTAEGGGSDRPARVMQEIFRERKLLDVPTLVVNKPGGIGTVGMVYMNQHAGDGHYLSMANVTLVTNHLNGTSALSYAHTTPLALLANDYMIIVVRADSPFKTARELFTQMAKDPASLTGGMTTRGGSGHIGLGQALKSMGGDPRKIKFVVFRSGAEAVTAAMGGHIDYAVSVVPSIIGPFSGGKLRVLGVAAPQRLEGALAQSPTLNEQGLKSVSSNWRMAVGPKGMTPGQVEFWDNTLGRLVQTPDWKKELQTSLQEYVYLNSRASLKYCEDQDRQLGAALGDIGLLKEH